MRTWNDPTGANNDQPEVMPGDLRQPPWHHVIPEDEQAIYRAAGFGTPFKGQISPALLVIDLQYRSVGHKCLPVMDSIREEYPTSCGEHGWRAVPHVARLMKKFREMGCPVIFPHVAPKSAADGGRFADKAPAVMSIPARGYQFVEEVAPCEGEIVIPKYHPSAFFGTPLISHLINLKVDTVFLTGCTTSGCIRASAIDATSYGLRIVVPHECVFDRSQVSHAVNLFDMASKYADVMPTDDALALMDERIKKPG
ncbi:isochorismatase family protein [uncultured Pigmentiphaga sp.]|uniref:isochorismatase family protein n=1 Tax=uncultured Pigmentiphaga sp. TaxID=340361 RepID=UPI002601EA9B|nr:isochorismatase family protein [uncultured Pigmentiphaga sp.]